MFSNSSLAENKDDITTLIHQHSVPDIHFHHAVLLSDQEHLAVVWPTRIVKECILRIWNIKTQHWVKGSLDASSITSMTLVGHNELAIVMQDEVENRINRYSIRLPTSKNPTCGFSYTGTINHLSSTHKITTLQDRSFVMGFFHRGGVEIIDLSTNTKIHSFDTSSSAFSTVKALDVLPNGSLVIADSEGNIFTYHHDTRECFLRVSNIGMIQDLVTLPDNTIVFIDDNNALQHWDFETFTQLSCRKRTKDFFPTALVCLPDGLIGCCISDSNFTKYSFELFEPYWVRNELNEPQKKEIVCEFLPSALSEVVMSYARVSTLFQPHNRFNNANSVAEVTAETVSKFKPTVM